MGSRILKSTEIGVMFDIKIRGGEILWVDYMNTFEEILTRVFND